MGLHTTSSEISQLLAEIQVRMVLPSEEGRYQQQMARYHYLGALPKIGECIWYVAMWQDQWVAQITISAAALKCSVRDRWIGWDFRTQYGRLGLIANNSRFLILPDWSIANLGSRVLSLVSRRIAKDWPNRFGHPVLLLETFVDPQHFYGGVYRAANWIELGMTSGFRRGSKGYSPHHSPKRVFIRPLVRNCRVQLTHPDRNTLKLTGDSKIMLNAAQMKSLPSYFLAIPDPRRKEGIRHRLPVVLALAAAATLCGMRGYKAISNWVDSLGQQALERFGCRFINRHYLAPSVNVIRECLMRVDPQAFDQALNDWSRVWGTQQDQALAVDGKTMRNALDDDGKQIHILSAIGHDTKSCYAQKK
jgi:hypothetical protein